MTLAALLNLSLRFRMSGAVSSIHLYVFVAWRGTFTLSMKGGINLSMKSRIPEVLMLSSHEMPE